MRDARRRKRMDAKRKIYGVCRYTATRQEWRVPLEKIVSFLCAQLSKVITG